MTDKWEKQPKTGIRLKTLYREMTNRQIAQEIIELNIEALRDAVEWGEKSGFGTALEELDRRFCDGRNTAQLRREQVTKRYEDAETQRSVEEKLSR